jgi:hypothetical protein
MLRWEERALWGPGFSSSQGLGRVPYEDAAGLDADVASRIPLRVSCLSFDGRAAPVVSSEGLRQSTQWREEC